MVDVNDNDMLTTKDHKKFNEKYHFLLRDFLSGLFVWLFLIFMLLKNNLLPLVMDLSTSTEALFII